MPIKRISPLTKQDFEEALDYLGSSVSEIAKQTNIPRAYLSDLKNRNVRLRREHEDKLRSFLEDQGVEFEADDPPQSGRTSARQDSPHPAIEVATVVRRSLILDDAQDDDVVAAALDAQADRDARLSQLFAMSIQREGGLATLFGEPDLTGECKDALAEVRRLLAESYIVIGVLRGLRGFKVAAPDADPKTLGELLAKECASALEAAGMTEQSTEEPEPAARPAAPALANPARKSFELADL